MKNARTCLKKALFIVVANVFGIAGFILPSKAALASNQTVVIEDSVGIVDNSAYPPPVAIDTSNKTELVPQTLNESNQITAQNTDSNWQTTPSNNTPVNEVVIEPSATVQADRKLFTDVIIETDELNTLQSLLEDTGSLDTMLDSIPGTFSVFGPSNEAFSSLPSDEVTALTNNVDQLEQLLKNHIINNQVYFSVDLHDGDTITNIAGLELKVTIKDSSIYINDVLITTPTDSGDNERIADNGLVHIVAGILLPKDPDVTINDFATNKVSPALSGTICNGATSLEVRINGVSYDADIYIDSLNSTWTIPEGVVNLDPLSEDALFSLVAECPNDTLELNQSRYYPAQPKTEIALTMRNDVITYKPLPSEEESSGQTLGATITVATTVASAQTATTQYSAEGLGCGKGICAGESFAQFGNGEAGSTENQEGKTDDLAVKDQTQEDQSEGETEWWWWLIGLGSVSILWYLLWRRSGVESKE